jgi:hypothetical protein
LLDLLVLAPSSVAGLYGWLLRAWEYPAGFDVRILWDALEGMEAQGWVTAWQTDPEQDGSVPHRPGDEERATTFAAYDQWLPGAAWEEFSYDPIGLWFEVTSEGRAAWQQGDGERTASQADLWMLDLDDATQTIVIHAATEDVAHERLHWWLSEHPDMKVVFDSDRVEPVSSFTLRSGVMVRDGVRLVCRYQGQQRRKAS